MTDKPGLIPAGQCVLIGLAMTGLLFVILLL